MRPSKLKHKKRLQKINFKDKITLKQKGDVIHNIINSFLKHVLILFVVLLINFVLSRAMFQVRLIAWLENPPPEDYERIYESVFALTLWQHFFKYLGDFFTGNWGISIFTNPGKPVKELIFEKGLISLTISIIPICLALILETIYFYSKNHKKNQNKIIRVISLLIFSIPSYLGVLLFIYFLGNETYSQLVIQLILASLILSITTLTKIEFTIIKDKLYHFNQVNSVLKKTDRYNMKNKRLKFLNSFSSLNTFIISMIISELIIIEKVLYLPGLGWLCYEALFSRDFFLITAILFIFSITVVSISFIQSQLKLYYQMNIFQNIEINKPLNLFIKNKI